MINSFDMDAKIVQRKKTSVVYLKEGEQIVDILNVMEAHVALLELENVRILKEMRNSVNRKVNCETANINKTVSAAVRQMEDIVYIRDTMGFAGGIKRRCPYTSRISGGCAGGAGPAFEIAGRQVRGQPQTAQTE